MKSKNLLVNKEKTKYTTEKRRLKEEERERRNVIKLGSKLGDREDIQRRKELATIAFAKNDTIWKKYPAVRDASEKCTVVQRRNLEFVKGRLEKTKQFS